VQQYLMMVADIKLIKDRETEVGKWIEFFKLGTHAHKKASQLSGGNRKKMNMAAAVIGQPDILFLDEPSSGVDPSSRRDLWKVIRELKSNDSA
jgi:ABC-2 type transport system ATP-binding protein